MKQEAINLLIAVAIILIMDYMYSNDINHTIIIGGYAAGLFVAVSILSIIIFWITDKIYIPGQVDTHD